MQQAASSRRPTRRRRSAPIRRRSAPATRCTCRARSGSTRRPARWSTALEAQAHQVFRNMRAVAQAAGGSLDDIVKLSILLVDLGDFAKVNDIMATLLQGAVSGALDVPGRGAAARRAHRGRGASSSLPGRAHRARRGAAARRGAMAMARAPRTARQGRSEGRAAKPRGAAASPTSSRASASRATTTSCCTCRCATRTTRASTPLGAVRAGRRRAGRRRRRRTPTSSTGRAGSSCACCAATPTSARTLVLRFFTFYPSQQKALAPGKRVRVFGEVRDGLLRPRDGASAVSRRRRRARRCPIA